MRRIIERRVSTIRVVSFEIICDEQVDLDSTVSTDGELALPGRKFKKDRITRKRVTFPRKKRRKLHASSS